MTEAAALEREKKKGTRAGLSGRSALPPNVSNAEEDEVPTIETFGLVPRGYKPKGMTYQTHCWLTRIYME